MKLLLGDVFNELRDLKKNTDKSAWLRQHAEYPLFYILWLAFSDKVEWLLPDGAPPFTPWEEARGGRNRPGSEPTDLLRELRRLYLFLKGTGDRLRKMDREKRFAELLSVLPKPDRDLFVAIKDKRVATEYKLSKKLLDETFPGLLDAPFTNKFVSPHGR